RRPAERPAPRVSVRAELGLSGGIHRGRTNARQDGGRDPRRAGWGRIVARPRPRVSPHLDVAAARRARRSGIRDSPLQPGSSGPSRPFRGDARRSRDGVTAGFGTRDSRRGSTTPKPESRITTTIALAMATLITLFLNPVGWRGALGAFLLCRIADVIKPFPADRLESLHGGVGVMADDGMAAVYANLTLRVCLWLSGRLVIWSLIVRSASPMIK